MSLYAPNPQEFPNRLTNIQAAIQNTFVAPTSLTVVPTGGSATHFTYAVVARFGSDTVPTYASITTGVATLTTSAYNTLSWTALTQPNTAPVVYDVYRTVGGVAQGIIASGLTVTSLVDTGLTATTQAVPFNSTAISPGSNQARVQVVTATGAGVIVVPSGIVFLNAGGAATVTLALPIAGSIDAGGQDGMRLTIYSNTAEAHTVTTPTDGLNGADHIATFANAAGNYIELFAYSGSWYSTNNLNVTLS